MRHAPPRLVDLLVVITLVVIAAAIRLPELETIPAYTDEVSEAEVALQILDEGARPLVHNDSYRGPLWAYLLAGWLKLYGIRPAATRAFALVLGSFTVGATYLLGRILAGRVAGLIAALLMTTSFSHVALNSHVAWSNNSTPLWTTLALACTVLGSSSRNRAGGPSAKWLVIAGGLWGAALHTHPSVAAMLLGTVAWFLLDSDRRKQLRTPGPWLGVALGIAVLSPLILYNLRHTLVGVSEAVAPRQPIAADHGPVALSRQAVALAMQLGRMAGAGALEESAHGASATIPGLTSALRLAATILYGALLVGALYLASVRRARVLGVVAVVSAGLLLAVNQNYESFYDTRYLAFLLPLAYCALGVVLSPQLVAGSERRLLVAGLIAGLALYPLLALGAFYQQQRSAGATNEPMIEVADRLADRAHARTENGRSTAGGLEPEAQDDNHPGMYTFVDKGMRPIKLGGGGDPTRAFDLILLERDINHELSDVDEMRWFLLNDSETTFWFVAASDTAATLNSEFDLRSWEQGDGWVVLERAP